MENSESDTAKVFKPASNLLPADNASTSNASENNAQSIPPPEEPVRRSKKKKIEYNPESDYYDMTGDKKMLVFNHSDYDVNEFYGETPPKYRKGTHCDFDALYKVFTNLGFDVKEHPNKTFKEIETILKQVCENDQSGTSCVAVVILTHGSYDGVLCARDRPYFLSQILKLFETGHYSLINIPKLFFIQAPESVIHSDRLVDKVAPLYDCDCDSDSEECKHQISNNKACRGNSVDVGRMTHHDGINKKVLHVGSHVNFLIARSTVENYKAWREDDGSWYIQELCDIFQENYKNLEILQMLTLVTRRVTYEYKSHKPTVPKFHHKKETPETKFTLTKFLKF